MLDVWRWVCLLIVLVLRPGFLVLVLPLLSLLLCRYSAWKHEPSLTPCFSPHRYSMSNDQWQTAQRRHLVVIPWQKKPTFTTCGRRSSQAEYLKENPVCPYPPASHRSVGEGRLHGSNLRQARGQDGGRALRPAAVPPPAGVLPDLPRELHCRGDAGRLWAATGLSVCLKVCLKVRLSVGLLWFSWC